MSDDRKEEASEADIQKQEPENAAPIVPSDDRANMIAIGVAQRRSGDALLDDSANMIAIRAAQRRSAALFADSTAQGVGTASPVGVTLTGAIENVSLSGTLTLDWAAFRDELNPRLEAIEAGLRAIAPVIEGFETWYREHARIGHNNPPEDIDVLPIDLAELELGIIAANMARTEINAEHPRFDVLRLCGRVLRWIGGSLLACIKWIGVKVDLFIAAVLKNAARWAAPVLVAKLADINLDVDVVVGKIRQILDLLKLPS